MRGIYEPGVDIPEFAEAEEIGGVFCAVKDERAGAVDRNRTGVRSGIWLVASVEANGLEFHQVH